MRIVLFVMSSLLALACTSTSVGGKRRENTGRNGHTDNVDSYCMANCVDRNADNSCAEFQAEAAPTCAEFLHATQDGS